jgi:hypothetical protein
LELATEVGDTYLEAIALACGGVTMLDQGHPGEALKMLQFAQIKSWTIPSGHDRRMVESCTTGDRSWAAGRRRAVRGGIGCPGGRRQQTSSDPTRPWYWPPSTSKAGNKTAWRWPTERSPT